MELLFHYFPAMRVRLSLARIIYIHIRTRQVSSLFFDQSQKGKIAARAKSSLISLEFIFIFVWSCDVSETVKRSRYGGVICGSGTQLARFQRSDSSSLVFA